MEKIKFGFEDLEVWQKSIKFAKLTINLTDTITAERKHYRLLEQMESAASSVALNIAEGKGRYSKKEYIQFLYIARGSLFETISLLTIFRENNWISQDQLDEIKIYADEISKMLSGLINYLRS
ncbi:MAG: four helix bundle protein, partial [Candidatus Omnitrophota bacterium]